MFNSKDFKLIVLDELVEIDDCASLSQNRPDFPLIGQRDLDGKEVASSKPAAKERRAYEVVPEGVTMQERLMLRVLGLDASPMWWSYDPE